MYFVLFILTNILLYVLFVNGQFCDFSAAGFPIEVEVVSERQTIPLENSCSRPHIVPSSELEISENLLGRLSNLMKITDVDLDLINKTTLPLLLDLSIGTG